MSDPVKITLSAMLPAGTYTIVPVADAPPPPPPPPAVEKPWLGVHLESNSDYNRGRYFADVMRSARPWGTVASPFGSGAATDADGWPTTDCATIVLTDCGTEVAGDYMLTWEGGGTLKVSGGGRVVFGTTSVPGLAGVAIWKGNVTLTFTGTTGGVRNVRLFRPGYGPSETFADEFLKALAPFTVIRTMDWTGTNNSTVAKWSDRPQLTDATWATPKGVPWEVVFALAKASGKDLWINVPALADDDYVRQLRDLANATLPATTKVYVEYSNEVWNGQFKAWQQNYDAAKADVAAGDKTLIAPDGAKPDYVRAAWRRVARRSVEIKRILGADDPRWRMVLPIQVNGGSDMLPQMLAYITANAGEPSRFVYGVAGAPYFSPGKDSTGKDWTKNTPITTDDILARLAERAPLHAMTDGMRAMLAACTRYGLKPLCYEMGVDLQQYATDLDAKIASQVDPRMGPIFESYLNTLYANGLQGGNVFSLTCRYGRFGYWGVTQDAGDLTTPKYQACARVSSTLAGKN